jgi:hypothetical protein
MWCGHSVTTCREQTKSRLRNPEIPKFRDMKYGLSAYTICYRTGGQKGTDITGVDLFCLPFFVFYLSSFHSRVETRPDSDSRPSYNSSIKLSMTAARMKCIGKVSGFVGSLLQRTATDRYIVISKQSLSVTYKRE